jgi:hypothetical protein
MQASRRKGLSKIQMSSGAGILPAYCEIQAGKMLPHCLRQGFDSGTGLWPVASGKTDRPEAGPTKHNVVFGHVLTTPFYRLG